MFQWLDLVAPIGVSIVSVFLCVWGLTKAKVTGAKVACVACGLAFLAFTPAWYGLRCSGLTPDYTSMHGLKVVKGEKNLCSRELVEGWTSELITFWDEHCTNVAPALQDKLVVCRDEEKIGVMGRWVRGYTTGSTAVIGWNGKIGYTKSLFRHELSHIIAMIACNKPYDEDAQHAYFKEVGLK